MRLHLISDLHLDHEKQHDDAFLRDYRNEDGAELVVVAGDAYSTCRPKATGQLLQLLRTMYEDVIFVPGNHDYWMATPDYALQEFPLAAQHDPHVHLFMGPGFLEVAGQRFFGATMWYPRPSKRKEQNFIDMHQVHAPPSWFFNQYQLFRSRLDDVLPTDVVVTHHLPHPRSTPDRFRGSRTDHFFMTNLTGPILDLKPKLWLHGHTHDASDYKVGETRIVCNPRGYPHEYKVRPPYKPYLIEV